MDNFINKKIDHIFYDTHPQKNGYYGFVFPLHDLRKMLDCTPEFKVDASRHWRV